MGRGVVHVGTTGSGALLKLINNFLAAVQAVSLAEAITLIERSGLDRATALDVLLNGAPGSPMLKVITARINGGDFAPMEEPDFRMPSRYGPSCDASCASGQKKSLRRTSSQSQRLRSTLCGPICTNAARMRIPDMILRAMAPAATREAVSRADERPPPR